MGIVVLLELIEPLDARILGVGGDLVDALSVRRAHTTSSDPDAPGGPGALTLCEMDAAAMVVDRSTGRARSGRGRGGIRRAGPDTSA
ncbi:hypothetical protein [Kitasatospora sp. NPDC087314]|uniref:hypothetical protein n=1 Tax=Kitasatospora sp. NPDC087314 TaxID=3364068 RepID=UPI00382B7A59